MNLQSRIHSILPFFYTVNNYSPLQALYRQMLFFFFFPYALEYKIFSQKLYHLLNLHIKYKTSAYTYRHLIQVLYANALHIGTCFRFYSQKRVEKKTKVFAYKIYSHFTQQCILSAYQLFERFVTKEFTIIYFPNLKCPK